MAKGEAMAALYEAWRRRSDNEQKIEEMGIIIVGNIVGETKRVSGGIGEAVIWYNQHIATGEQQRHLANVNISKKPQQAQMWRGGEKKKKQ